jgi:cyclic pyranopterin phosphate synthase
MAAKSDARDAGAQAASGAEFSHLDPRGRARMVDVGEKSPSVRLARAAGEVRMAPATVEKLRRNEIGKGNVLAVAQTAGIMAAKRTAELIPLCHPLAIEHLAVEFEVAADRVIVESTVRLTGKTGAEMEALTAVAVAALTIYDMCKAIDKEMIITQVRLLEKSGGRSGHYQRDARGKGVDGQ